MSMVYNAEFPKKITEDELRKILKVDGDKYVIEIPVPNNCPAIYEVMIQEGKSNGGEMPPMPEIESAGMLGQLNQIVAMNVDPCQAVAMNVDPCQALKVICEMIGA